MAGNAVSPGCWVKLDCGLVGPRPDTGESSWIWQCGTVSEVGAASVAKVGIGCAGFRVRTGSGAQSGTMVAVDCGLGTMVKFESTGLGVWVTFVGIISGS